MIKELVIVMPKDKYVVYEGKPHLGWSVTVPGVGTLEKDRPKLVTKKQLEKLLEMDIGCREFDDDKEVMKPPMDAESTEVKPKTKKKTAKKKTGKKKSPKKKKKK